MTKKTAAALACGLTIGLFTWTAHATTPPATATVPIVKDPCEGLQRCASGGPFIAQVLSLIPQGGPQDRHHSLKMQVRLRNISTQPIVLGYKSGSNSATDNLGNAYVYGRPGTHDTSFSGIGLVTGRQADPSFVLQPGEARNATFSVIRFNSGGKELGTAWAYDVVIDLLEILPSKQIRTASEYSLHFDNLSAGMPSVTSPAATAPPDLEKAVEDIRNLFKKKNK